MRTVVIRQLSVISWRRHLLVGLLLTAMSALSCSIPSLESPECNQARGTVRELYSFHFGNEMEPSKENLEVRSKWITQRLKNSIADVNSNYYDTKPLDEFTKTVSDRPRAFRVGKCTSGDSKANARFEVVLFWKDDSRNDQRTLTVATVKQGEKWLVDDIALEPR